MDWNTILQVIADAGHAVAPVIANVVMLVAGVLFYRATGFLPGFVRAYVERAYREKEALFRDSITRALRNGITAAVSRGKTGPDALQEALDHAMKSNPEAVAHFTRTSNMDRETLRVMAERESIDLGMKLTAPVVVEGQG